MYSETQYEDNYESIFAFKMMQSRAFFTHKGLIDYLESSFFGQNFRMRDKFLEEFKNAYPLSCQEASNDYLKQFTMAVCMLDAITNLSMRDITHKNFEDNMYFVNTEMVAAHMMYIYTASVINAHRFSEISPPQNEYFMDAIDNLAETMYQLADQYDHGGMDDPIRILKIIDREEHLILNKFPDEISDLCIKEEDLPMFGVIRDLDIMMSNNTELIEDCESFYYVYMNVV